MKTKNQTKIEQMEKRYKILDRQMEELINCVDSPFGMAKEIRQEMNEIESALKKAKK